MRQNMWAGRRSKQGGFIGALIGAGASLVGGFLSKKEGDKNREQASQINQRAEDRLDRAETRLNEQLDALERLTPPNLMSYVRPFQDAVIQGTLTPEEATAELIKRTEMDGLRVPPELIAAQTNALRTLEKTASESGLTAMDRAKLFQAKNEMATASRGAQEAILQNAAQRGVAGSGVEMANRMLAQQAAATRGAASGVEVAAEAQRRALEASARAGDLAGRMRGQSVEEQTAVAQARDAVNRFNTELTNRTNAANVATRNEAQAANLAERQRIAEFNLRQREREAAQRLSVAQDSFNNTMDLAKTRTNAAAGQATNATSASNTAFTNAANLNATAAGQTANAFQQGASAIGQLADAWEDKDKKDD